MDVELSSSRLVDRQAQKKNRRVRNTVVFFVCAANAKTLAFEPAFFISSLRAREVQASLTRTSTLLRVAFEYGQTLCPVSTSACASRLVNARQRDTQFDI